MSQKKQPESETLRLPEGVEIEHLRFLDELRKTGAVNMMGARPYLAEAFGLDKEASRKAHAFWMETYPQRHPR